MALYVQKYGGSSVADAKCMMNVAERIRRTRKAGHDVVVVVSAMGDATDDLIDLAKQVNPDPDPREMDVLLSTGEQVSIAILTMALHRLGVPAMSFTGPQAGIVAESIHLKGRIVDVKPQRIRAALDGGKVVIVAGFQGLDPAEDIVTLGRGGSDMTAVALAWALKADRCQFYKDVTGVFTSDPRVVPGARKLDEISYDEMLELASMGAAVLQSRAVEFAKAYGVTLEVLSSFEDKPGTLVKEEVKAMENIVVRGVAADKKQAKVTMLKVPDRPGIAAGIFNALAKANINVDMIVLNVSGQGQLADLSFTVPETDLKQTLAVLQAVVPEVSSTGVVHDNNIAKVSIVGVGMRSHSGIAARMFSTLAQNGIDIHMISTSEIKISVVIPKPQADEAVRVLHGEFRLEQEAAAAAAGAARPAARPAARRRPPPAGRGRR
ncbi:MAG: aspartate kinase [Lentisphaerae bacterium]|nr:aspartate kinase [Lentisphaerota bacterium]